MTRELFQAQNKQQAVVLEFMPEIRGSVGAPTKKNTEIKMNLAQCNSAATLRFDTTPQLHQANAHRTAEEDHRGLQA